MKTYSPLCILDNTALIIGAAVGGSAFVLLLIVIVCVIVRCQKDKPKPRLVFAYMCHCTLPEGQT